MDKLKLRQYRYLVKEIEQLEEERMRLSAGLVGAVNINDMPHSYSIIHDRMAEVAAKMVDMQGELADKLNELYALRKEIEECINNLEPRESLLMRYRYIDGKRWEQIAVDMDYEYSWVLRLHGRILKDINKNKRLKTM